MVSTAKWTTTTKERRAAATTATAAATATTTPTQSSSLHELMSLLDDTNMIKDVVESTFYRYVWGFLIPIFIVD